MKTFFGIVLFLALSLFVLAVCILMLISLGSLIKTVIKHKPKSYAQLKQAIKTDKDIAIRDSETLKAYKEKLTDICSKPIIDDADIDQLTTYVENNNLSKNRIQHYSHKAFKQHYSVVMEDNLLTEEELISIDRLLGFLNLNSSLIEKELKEIAKHLTLRDISIGRLPQVETSAIALKRDELAHFIVLANLREERVISRGYKGGSQGVSIRIAKGMTYRVGQNRGKLVSEKGIVDVDSGDFIVTSQRLIFIGAKKSFSYEYKKLLAWNVFSDGISLSFDNAASRNLSFEGEVDADVLYFLLSYLVERSR